MKKKTNFDRIGICHVFFANRDNICRSIYQH